MSRCRHELNQPPPSPEGEQEKARFQQQHEARNRALRQEEAKATERERYVTPGCYDCQHSVGQHRAAHLEGHRAAIRNDAERAELDRYIAAQDEIMGCLRAFADALEAGADSIKAMAATLEPSGAGLQAVNEADRRAARVRNLLARIEGKP